MQKSFACIMSYDRLRKRRPCAYFISDYIFNTDDFVKREREREREKERAGQGCLKSKSEKEFEVKS
jgi:hypothetical protein